MEFVKIPKKLLTAESLKLTPQQMADIINKSTTAPQIIYTPAIKGRAAEIKYIDVFRKTFCVRDTAKTGGKGDMIIWKSGNPHIKILVEIKNYSNKVPTKELEKWNRDILSTGCQGALFISNQPVNRGKNLIINNNSIILITNNSTVAVAAADLLHHKLLIELTHIFADKFIKFNEQFVMISEYIEELNKIGDIILSLQNTVNKKCGELYKIYTETKHKINSAINKIIMPHYKKEVVDKFTVPQIGFFIKNPATRNELEEILNDIKCDNLQRVISQKKVEYMIDKKIIGIDILKSKAYIYYHIDKLDIDYPIEFISIKGNLLKIEISNKSYKKMILLNIRNNLSQLFNPKF